MDTTPPTKALRIALWVGQVLLFAFFVLAAMNHGFAAPDELYKTSPWAKDLPLAQVRFIGWAELAGAIGVLLPALTRILPKLVPLAAFGLGLIMTLAIPFHLSRGETFALPFNAIPAALAYFVAWGRFWRAPISPR